MARTRKADIPPDGGWIAPGPGHARTAEEHLAGVGAQTQEEYEAEISGGRRHRSWRSVFRKQSVPTKQGE